MAWGERELDRVRRSALALPEVSREVRAGIAALEAAPGSGGFATEHERPLVRFERLAIATVGVLRAAGLRLDPTGRNPGTST